MISKIHYAIAWKELRQSLWILIAFFALPFLVDGYIYIDQLKTPRPGINDYITQFSVIFAFIVSMCIAYLIGAGFRVIEASQGLNNFLRIQPILYSMVLRTYYILGILVWLVWILFLLLQTIYELILFGYSGLIIQPIKVYLLFVTSFFGIYSLTFFSAYLRPTFTCTATTFWTTLILITVGEYSPRMLYDWLRLILQYYPFLILLLLGGMGYLLYILKKERWDWKSLLSN